MMIDKKISVGTLITIATIGATVIFTQGAASHRIEYVEKETYENKESIKSIVKEVNQNKIDIGKIETKIDEGFKRIENLFIEN